MMTAFRPKITFPMSFGLEAARQVIGVDILDIFEAPRPAEPVTDGIDLQEPALADLLQYWSRARNGREFPARRDLDPADMRPLLGYIALFDVIHEPELRFRF